MGKIIVIESGTDASGKETQTKRLFERLKKDGKKVVKFSFPNYKSESSSIVKMYLNGDFGDNPDDVNPYITSTFFAVDRYATFKKEMEKYYNEEDTTLIIDRYTTSNMAYQASKIDGLKEREDFLEWLYDYEFNLYKLPKPDLVVFLDLPVEKATDLKNLRNSNKQNELVKDIHENDLKFLKKTYYNAKYVSTKYKWTEVNCLKNGELRSIEDISDEVYEIVKKKLF